MTNTENYTYAVVEVDKNRKIRVKYMNSHSRMMKAVKGAIARRNHYTVIRKPVACTTV